MARMNIYVPDDLKSRMDEAEGVNWSPLACRAFELKLGEIITAKGTRTMQDLISRLRAQKAHEAAVSEAAFARSAEIGRRWAESGEASLANFRLFSQAYGGERSEPPEPGTALAKHVAHVAKMVGSGAGLDPDEVHVDAFASGVMEVWTAVKDQI
jgi:hypothetical protein